LSSDEHSNAELLNVVIENSCNQAYTYSIDQVERTLRFQGESDLHDRKYDQRVRSTTFEEFSQHIGIAANGIPISNATEPSHCLYRFKVYPTQDMETKYITNEPVLFAVVSAVFFFVYQSRIYCL
jgi:hypothetical protein